MFQLDVLVDANVDTLHVEIVECAMTREIANEVYLYKRYR